MNALRPIVLFSVAAVAVAAQAQQVTLRFNPPTGKTYKYRMNTTSEQSGMPQMSGKTVQSMTMTLKIVSNTGGKVTMDTSISDVKVTLPPGNPAASMGPQLEKTLSGFKATTTVDSLGHSVAAKVTGGNQMMQSIMSSVAGGLGTMYSYPKQAIGIGSKWSVPFDLGKMMGGMMPSMKITGGKTNIVCTLAKFETQGGKRIAVINTSMTASMTMNMGSAGAGAGSVATSLSSAGTLRVDVATGVPTAVSSDSNGVTTMGSMKMNQKSTSSMKMVG